MMLSFFAVALSLPAQEPPYYVDNRGRTVEVEGISADDRGNLTLDLGDGARRTIRPAEYRYAFIEKPDAVSEIERLFEGGDYDRLLEEIEPVYNEYRFLGWGGLMAYWHGRALLAQDSPVEAREILERGERHAIDDEQRSWITASRAAASLELEDYDEVEELLEELRYFEGDYPAAFSFYARARKYVARGDEDQAILELLKTVLLFEPRDERLANLREEAGELLLSILKEREDPAFERVKRLY